MPYSLFFLHPVLPSLQVIVSATAMARCASGSCKMAGTSVSKHDTKPDLQEQKPLLEQRTARFCSFPSSTRLCGTIRWVGRSDRYAHGKRHYIRLDAFKTWIFFTYGDGQNGRHCMKIEIVDNEAERGRTAPAISSRVELFGLLCRPCKVTKNQLSGRAYTT